MVTSSFLFHNFVNANWNIMPDTLETMKSVVMQKVLRGETFSQMTGINDDGRSERGLVQRVGNIAVLNIEGVLVPKASWIDSMCGLTSTLQLNHEFDKLVVDPTITRIVLYINSPGGVGVGIQEFAQSIFEARSEKEIVAYVDVCAASAGYWLASACEHIVATPSATLGSIGTYIVVNKKKPEAQSEETYIFQAGTKKLYGSPDVPITDEEKAHFQNRVAEHNQIFLDAVSKYRNVPVEAVAGLQAGHFSAQNAPTWLYTEIGNTKMVMA